MERSQSAEVGGKITHFRTTKDDSGGFDSGWGQAAWLAWRIFSALLNLIFALLLVAVFWPQVIKVTGAMINRPLASLAKGFVAFIIIPIAGLLFLITIIGIPVAIIVFFLYGALLFLARIFAAIAIGRLVMRLRTSDRRGPYYTAAVIGVVLAWLVFSIPALGWFISFLAAVWGLGGFWEAWRNRIRARLNF